MQVAFERKESDRPDVSRKPVGGYIEVSTIAIGILWWCYSEGLLSLRAVRVCLALLELRLRRVIHVLAERKQGRRPKRDPKYTVSELADFCGLPQKRARAALSELETLGLVAEFSETRIIFSRSLTALALTEEQRKAFSAWFSLVTKRKKTFIPRRILVLAAEASGPALIAAILGACIRCCWKYPDGFRYTGRISCGWLSRRFRLSLRAVQSAKEHLVSLEFLRRMKDVSLSGELVEINPEWHRLISLPETARGGGSSGTKSAGVEAPSGTKSAGVFLIESSLPPEEKSKDQRQSPGARPPETPGPGILIHSDKGLKTNTSTPSEKPLPSPRLSSIRPEDFTDVGRALVLFAMAVKCDLMPNSSEHSRLLWMAAIERARTAEVRNPAGVFLHIVKHKKWDYLSDGHYHAANERLKRHLFGSTHPVLIETQPLPKPVPEKPPLSKDAEIILEVRRTLQRRRMDVPVFVVLHNHSGWSRDRYDAALAELKGNSPTEAAPNLMH
jgi:hypothetical protein